MAAPDGSSGFFVDLNMLSQAITSVQTERDNISADLTSVKTTAGGLADGWKSPAHGTFDEVRTWFDRVSADLTELLDELILRMQKSHDNYKHAEETNFQNLTPQ